MIRTSRVLFTSPLSHYSDIGLNTKIVDVIIRSIACRVSRLYIILRWSSSTRTLVWLARSEPAKSIMNNLPWRMAVAVLDALHTVTLKRAWLLEDVLFALVGSTVRWRLPWCSRPITSSTDTTTTSASPATWMFRFLDVSSRSSRKPDDGFNRSLIFSLYISRYDNFTCTRAQEHTHTWITYKKTEF